MIDSNLREMERRFSEAVPLEFAFLSIEYAFHVSKANDRFIRYESSKACVTVTFDRGEMEVFVAPNAVGWTSLGYSVALMVGLQAETGRNESILEPCAKIQNVTNADEVQEGLKRQARCLRRFGILAIQGDNDYFERLRAYSERLVKEWQDQPRINHARRIADTLWLGRGYQQYLELMEPFIDQLTGEEQERVAIARMMLERD